ncbi:MAG: tRNA (adenosine(37)-N6)-threonylcarbamoyltransferase complex dimerization subunit type 1 TsaB [Candidatus Saccharimonadales bacterium]|nr:tRNA (adenosine(37)-N6)-threonylcarbamoyltransferase complex dimerization subunit type 1 TsaB [Candidatus Saccharimonadales bacterium]
MIITIRTDKPEAEIGLYNGEEQVDYVTWTAHRELSNTLLIKINQLLQTNQRTLDDATGLAVYKGPGSFTGLRIGMTVANTLAYSQSIPIISATGNEWISQAIKRLQSGDDEAIALPEYGGEANITKPKK